MIDDADVADDIAKSISAKKRKLEQVTSSSVSGNRKLNRKFDEVWKAQQSHRFISVSQSMCSLY